MYNKYPFFYCDAYLISAKIFRKIAKFVFFYWLICFFFHINVCIKIIDFDLRLKFFFLVELRIRFERDRWAQTRFAWPCSSN